MTTDSNHEAIAARLSEQNGIEVPASFVAAVEEVCGRPFEELTFDDLRRFAEINGARIAAEKRDIANRN